MSRFTFYCNVWGISLLFLFMATLVHSQDPEYRPSSKTRDLPEEFTRIRPVLPSAFGEPESFVQMEMEGTEWMIHSDKHKYGISQFGEQMIRIRWLEDGVSWIENSDVVVLEEESLPLISEDDQEIRFGTSDLKLSVMKNPLRFSFYWKERLILQEEIGFYRNRERPGIRFQLKSDEHIEGTGSRAIPINRNGRTLAFYNQPRYGYSGDEALLNINIPFLTSSRGYGLYFENNTPTLADIGESEAGIFTYEAYSGQLSYYLVTGDNYDEILDQYTELSGKQPLPPRWALGYIQSRFGYQNEGEARSVVRDFLINDFPLDALVLDLYWFGDQSVMGNLNWDRSRFSDPVGMIDDFNQQDIKTILIAETYITTLSSNFGPVVGPGLVGRKPGGGHYVIDNFWAGPAVLLDLTKPEAQEWIKGKYRARLEEGIAGWWSDLGEPELHPDDMVHAGGQALEVHNIYSNIWMNTLEEIFREMRPDERLFNLIRSGYAGMQRYSTFPWSGDVRRNFEGLRSQIPIMLGMSMSGVAYMSSDVGGFTGDVQPELSVRWFQQATYSPIMRAHGVGDAPEPFYLPEAERNIVRKYMKLRYQMLPYNQTLAWLNTTTGRPLAMPMHYFDQTNTSLQNIDDQYFWGEDLIIAPLMEDGARARTVVLPQGRWYHESTDQVYDGGHTIAVAAPLDEIPVFVKAGSVIPYTAEISNTANYTPHYVIHYYPDQYDLQDTFIMFEDFSLNVNTLEDEGYSTFLIEADKREENKLRILFENQGPTQFIPEADPIPFDFIIHRITGPPGKITNWFLEIGISDNYDDFLSSRPSAWWDSNRSILHIKTTGLPYGTELIVEDIVSEVENGSKPDEQAAIFPNPTSDLVHIIFQSSHDSSARLAVYNSEMKLVAIIHPTYHGQESRYTWHLSEGDQAGTYFLLLSGNRGRKWSSHLSVVE